VQPSGGDATTPFGTRKARCTASCPTRLDIRVCPWPWPWLWLWLLRVVLPHTSSSASEVELGTRISASLALANQESDKMVCPASTEAHGSAVPSFGETRNREGGNTMCFRRLQTADCTTWVRLEQTSCQAALGAVDCANRTHHFGDWCGGVKWWLQTQSR